jgi:hypothetical protein
MVSASVQKKEESNETSLKDCHVKSHRRAPLRLIVEVFFAVALSKHPSGLGRERKKKILIHPEN